MITECPRNNDGPWNFFVIPRVPGAGAGQQNRIHATGESAARDELITLYTRQVFVHVF